MWKGSGMKRIHLAYIASAIMIILISFCAMGCSSTDNPFKQTKPILKATTSETLTFEELEGLCDDGSWASNQSDATSSIQGRFSSLVAKNPQDAFDVFWEIHESLNIPDDASYVLSDESDSGGNESHQGKSFVFTQVYKGIPTDGQVKMLFDRDGVLEYVESSYETIEDTLDVEKPHTGKETARNAVPEEYRDKVEDIELVITKDPGKEGSHYLAWKCSVRDSEMKYVLVDAQSGEYIDVVWG